MENKTNFLDFDSRPANGGVQYKAFFDNGYGVSIVKHDFSYGGNLGLWELAVLEGNKDNSRLCYETPITSDVLGYLENDEVNEIVDKIKALPNVVIDDIS